MVCAALAGTRAGISTCCWLRVENGGSYQPEARARDELCGSVWFVLPSLALRAGISTCCWLRVENGGSYQPEAQAQDEFCGSAWFVPASLALGLVFQRGGISARWYFSGLLGPFFSRDEFDFKQLRPVLAGD